MNDRQLIADLLSALEYHTEQTRPIQFSKVAIEAAREYLRKPAPAQRKPLTDVQIKAMWRRSKIFGTNEEKAVVLARAIEATHSIGVDK